jgi:intermembrane space import and assembly protein 40
LPKNRLVCCLTTALNSYSHATERIALPTTDTESETLPTLDSIAAERQRRKEEQARLDAQQLESAKQQEPAEGGIQGLESEADQQGAFNPETGEINWDCPCLGGMATGPCGDQFKAAFSCFVYSTEEPKGMDCVDKFKYVYTLCTLREGKAGKLEICG